MDPTDLPAGGTSAGPGGASAGGSRQYRVQKGDTLFRIAKSHYGNGNRWQQIAAANPGLSPASLQAGATITVP
jgi:5'-nucleotidase